MTSARGFVVVLALSCSGGGPIDLGRVSDGKSDAPEIRERAVTLPPRVSEDTPSRTDFTVTSDLDFRVELRYQLEAETRIVVTGGGAETAGQPGSQPTLVVEAGDGEVEYTITLENLAPVELPAKLSVLGADAVSAELYAAARANLERVAREIDDTHLGTYRLAGEIADRFLAAVELEYRAVPDQYAARMAALGSMIFFAAPEVAPPPSGKATPFHGLDMDQFAALIRIEDEIFDHLTEVNGGLVGVRPFSVCETRYLIDTYVRPRAEYPGFEAHQADYAAAAAACPPEDLADWYNFRGLGHLRPSWIESNVMDRFLRRMVKECREPSSAWTDECARWDEDRLAYRREGNRQLASRLLFYDPAGQAEYFRETGNALALLEDRDGNGIGEFLRPGPVTKTSGETGELSIQSTGEFSGSLKFKQADGTISSVTPRQLVAESAIDPAFQAGWLDRPDFGLQARFADPTGCTGEALDPAACPLLERFYILIDRHEDFYQTYSALNLDWWGVSSQPSPLVACSITLGAAHGWDSAGIPEGGRAGFIFLMRIPFAQILAGSKKSVATLEPGPEVLAIQDLYEGRDLDMAKVWLDIASLSNNLYSSEHEISKFGNVPAEQIEGILVVRKPAAMP